MHHVITSAAAVLVLTLPVFLEAENHEKIGEDYQSNPQDESLEEIRLRILERKVKIVQLEYDIKKLMQEDILGNRAPADTYPLLASNEAITDDGLEIEEIEVVSKEKKSSLKTYRQEQRRDKSLLYHRLPSFFSGAAVLKNPESEGSALERIGVVGYNRPVWRRQQNVSLGVFGTVDRQDIEDFTLNRVGFGLSASIRLWESFGALSGNIVLVGAGYRFDRDSESDLDDQTGPFVVFSVNILACADLTISRIKDMFL